MGKRSNALAFLLAVIVAVCAGMIFFYVQDMDSTTKTRVEEPYKRTENAPPDAVEDETSHPDLKNDKSGVPEPQGQTQPQGQPQPQP